MLTKNRPFLLSPFDFKTPITRDMVILTFNLSSAVHYASLITKYNTVIMNGLLKEMKFQ